MAKKNSIPQCREWTIEEGLEDLTPPFLALVGPAINIRLIYGDGAATFCMVPLYPISRRVLLWVEL